MAQYRQYLDVRTGSVSTCIIKVGNDGQLLYIPPSLDNVDWAAYQAWLLADPSNQPDPAE